MNKEISVLEMKLLPSGSIKAFADISINIPEFGDLTIFGFRVVKKEGKDSSPWVAVPSLTYEKNGIKKNKRMLEMSVRLRLQVVQIILAEYEKRSSAI